MLSYDPATLRSTVMSIPIELMHGAMRSSSSSAQEADQVGDVRTANCQKSTKMVTEINASMDSKLSGVQRQQIEDDTGCIPRLTPTDNKFSCVLTVYGPRKHLESALLTAEKAIQRNLLSVTEEKREGGGKGGHVPTDGAEAAPRTKRKRHDSVSKREPPDNSATAVITRMQAYMLQQLQGLEQQPEPPKVRNKITAPNHVIFCLNISG